MPEGLSNLLYRLRTESSSPSGHAWSVAVGTLIGCFPIFGLHLPLCVVVGKCLRLNRAEMYIATNINNPLVAPFLVFIEIQLGSLILNGRFRELSLGAVKAISLTSVLAELAVGSTVLGVLLGATLGVGTFRLAKALSGDEFRNLLIERTAQAYLPSGFLNWERVRTKLRFDGTYVSFIRQGLFPAHGTLVDASSGNGVLLALANTYSDLAKNREQPNDWPSFPSALNFIGFVSTEKEERIARSALRGGARVERRDLREGAFPRCEALVLLDVLDRYSADEQAGILDRATAALKPSGVLLIRDRKSVV